MKEAKKYGSIAGSSFYVLLNIQGEHPLAADHTLFWARLLCCLAWVLGTLTVAIP